MNANKMTGETRLLYVRTPLPIFMRLLWGCSDSPFVAAFCFIIFTPADWPKTFLNWLFLLGVAFFGLWVRPGRHDQQRDSL